MPKALCLATDASIIGTPFYIMEHVQVCDSHSPQSTCEGFAKLGVSQRLRQHLLAVIGLFILHLQGGKLCFHACQAYLQTCMPGALYGLITGPYC